jgi:predicted dehydrogenase
MTRERRIGIGVLGCSDIARRRFLPAVLAAGNARLAGIGTRDPERARSFFPDPAWRLMRYEDLLADPAVHLVYISLPNHLHEEWTLKAFDRGKHVICEKPLGLTAASVERMADSAARGGLLLYENIMYLHHPRHRKVRELIEAGAIGAVRSVRAAFGFRLAGHEGFRRRPEQGGGSFHDLARYPVSTALHFLQGRDYRFSGYSYFRRGLNVAMSARAVTSAGETFSFSIGFEQEYECWYEIAGDKGKIRVERAYTPPSDMDTVVEVVTGRERTSLPVPAADQFLLMIEHVCGLLLKGGAYADALEHARRLALLADQALGSCRIIEAPGR